MEKQITNQMFGDICIVYHPPLKNGSSEAAFAKVPHIGLTNISHAVFESGAASRHAIKSTRQQSDSGYNS